MTTSATKARLESDHAVLAACRDSRARLRMQMEQDRSFRENFSQSIETLLQELWPLDDHDQDDEHIAIASNDIDHIPVRLLEKLSYALTRSAVACRSDDAARSAAETLFSDWLTVRRIELEGDDLLRRSAHTVKQDYVNLLNRLPVGAKSDAS